MRKFLFTLILTWAVCSCFAQGQVIRGKVTDEKGEPLPGVTVTLKSTTRRVLTNTDGNYSLNLGTESGKMLVFTFMGYEAQEINVTGKLTADVKLVPRTQNMQEVVVTAFNISREKKSLGYAVQGVNVDQMTEARSNNITDLLGGKVSGLQIITSGQPTGSTRVQLRGANSITGNNQPLWVVDGVPIDNNDSNGQVGNLDYGNNAADLNPDDIENIEVLKGPNAAALYGSRAANGAILVTTKKGRKNAGIGISFNNNYMVSKILQYPDIQNVYGEGTNGRLNGTLTGPNGQGIIQAGSGGGRNWGTVLLGQPYLTISGQPISYLPQANTIKDLFKTGGTSAQNIAFSNATDNSAIRFSYTRTDANDVIQGQNVVKKNNFQFNGSHDFAKFLKIEGRIQYIQETVTNRTFRNEDPTNPFNYINNAVLSIPLNSLVPWKDANGNAFNSGGNSSIENPYWDINENGNQDTHNTIIGGVTMTLSLLKGLQFKAQESGNLMWGNRYTFIQKGSLSNPNGSYNEFQQNNRNWDTQAFFLYNQRIKDFSLNGNLGTEINTRNYYNTSASVSQLLVHDVRSLVNNASVAIANESLVRSQVNSVFGLASIGYKDFLYLDITGRNDWSSTLPSQSRSFFYPSASGSFVFTELWKNIPLTTSTEIGLELHFLNNRVTLDANVYKSATTNQLLTTSTPAEFGFSSQIVNAGKVQNKGLEITLSGTPVQTKNFSWSAVGNFSVNRNKVISLAPGITQFRLGGAVTASNYAEVGKPIGVLRAEDQQYSSNGYAIINPATGLPFFTSAIPGYTPIVGYASPRALASFGRDTIPYSAPTVSRSKMLMAL